MSSKVYLLWSGEYEDHHVDGVFATLEDAMSATSCRWIPGPHRWGEPEAGVSGERVERWWPCEQRLCDALVEEWTVRTAKDQDQ